MKTVILLMTLGLSLSSFAKIQNSTLNPLHEIAIEKAVDTQCGVRNLEISEVSSQIDWSELGDEFFTIKLNGTSRLDQNVLVDYAVEVKSVMWSQYNHDSKEWGVFEVQTVQCASK